MNKLQPTTQYRKDYKKIRKNAQKVKALREILEKLAHDEPIPAEYLPTN